MVRKSKNQETEDQDITYSTPKYQWVSSVGNHLVLTKKEGINIGEVTELYLDSKNKKISGFSLKKSLLSESYFVPMSEVENIGTDVIIIQSQDSIIPLAGLDKKNKRLAEIRGLWVTTMDGKHLGELEDIDISTETFQICDFLLTNKKSLPINADEITIGVDEILVPADYESKIREGGEFDGLKIKTGRRKNLIKNLSKKIPFLHQETKGDVA